MKKTVNDCSFTELWVSPENWKTTSAKSSLQKNWYVQCYFFDPTFKEKYPNGYPFRKKLNKFKTLEERKAAAKFFLEEIPKLFVDKGYNPITKKFMFDIPEDKNTHIDVTPGTPFIEALEFAKNHLKVAESTSGDLKSILKFVKQSAEQLRYSKIPISDIRRKHIRFIIDNLEKTQGEFSAHKFNKYRSYLQMLFAELLEFEAVETNIINDMRKRIQEKKIREVLTPEERLKIKNHLESYKPEFWTFIQIFFHSGGRITELLNLQIKDVDLNKQVYRTLIKKGKQYIWKERIIKDIALPLWRKLIFGAKQEDYVFSIGLVPGEIKMKYNSIRLRWTRTVQKPLNIKVGIYQLKHLNLDEVTELLSLEHAALMAGHTNTKMVEKVYAVKENDRAKERLKKTNNKFA